MSIWTAAALSAALMFQQAAATPAPAETGETTVDSLTVTARKVPEEEAIKGFVTSVSEMTANRRLGRWDRKVCPGVVNLRADYAQALNDRIAATATEVGLDVGEPGCKPNMIIIGTDKSEALARQLVKEQPDAFAKYDGAVRGSIKDLEAFQSSPAAIRWWHVTDRTTADGQRYVKGASVRVREVGRIKGSTRDDFASVIIIMDVSRIGKVRFTSLADYIAMVGLAQVDPDADLAGVSSVLNLFADRAAGIEPVAALTEWDKAYLKGLYAARRDVRRGQTQEDDITRSMIKDLGGTPPAKD